jgi:hypothetical protein
MDYWISLLVPVDEFEAESELFIGVRKFIFAYSEDAELFLLNFT